LETTDHYNGETGVEQKSIYDDQFGYMYGGIPGCGLVGNTINWN